MKDMHLLGMDFKDCSVKEAMHLVDSFLAGPGVSTVSFLSMDSCLEASDDESLKAQLQAMDLCVPATSDILEAAGIAGHSRSKEVEESKFCKELLKKLSNEKRSVFVLAGTEDEARDFADQIKGNASGINIVGSYFYENASEKADMIVNEINAAFPDVIISKFSSLLQDKFLFEQKTRLNAKVWVSLREGFLPDEDFSGHAGSLRKLLVKTLFRLKVYRFINERRNREKR